jgi:inner membrane protein
VAGATEYIPFAILGAVALDADVILMPFFRENPARFIFTHGGFTHSIFGAMAVATGASLVFAVATGFYPWLVQGLPWRIVYLSVVTGSLSHVGFDFLAYPGIPVLYPFRESKYTLGVFPGPSLIVMAISIFFVILFFLAGLPLVSLLLYACAVALFLAASGVIKAYVALTNRGRTIPLFSLLPLRWYVLNETGDAYQLSSLVLPRVVSPLRVFPKYMGITPVETQPYLRIPEVRRLIYTSYIVTVEKRGECVVFHDPIREERFMFYPPHFKKVAVPLER